MRRFLALLVAVAMILLAVLARNALDGDDGAGGDDSGGGDGATGSDHLTMICGPALRTACDRIAKSAQGVKVTVQAEAVTADAIASGRLDLDDHTVWLAAGDWPAIAGAGLESSDAGRARLDLASSDVLARSPAVIVGRTERMEAAATACGTLDWSCLGDHAGSPWTDMGGEPGWGAVKVGLPDVDAAAGMVSVNQAVASRVGRSDFATNDVADPAVAAWFDHLARESGKYTGGQEPLVQLIGVPGSLSMAGALESDAVRELSAAASAESFTVVAPEPVATADVRLWALDDEAVEGASERLGPEKLTDALGKAGWRIPAPTGTASPPSGAASIGADMSSLDATLPDTAPPERSGLPSAGTTFTVNRSWRDHQ